MAFWVYILQCADGSYYTGHTDNLEMRIQQHHAGAIASCYTLNRRPLKLVFSQDFTTREEALASEQQIKGWSRKKKEAMMRGDWAEVSRLAKSHQTVRPESLVCTQDRLVEGLEPQTPVHPELRACRAVEGHEPISPVRPEPVEGREPTTPVHPELRACRVIEGCGVEGQTGGPSVHPSTVRCAHGSGRTDGEAASAIIRQPLALGDGGEL